MIELKNSGVVFDKEAHTYELNGKRLKGITGLLHEKLFPQQYAGVSQEVLDKAAERGTLIHELTELYDSIGAEHEMAEVQGYIRLKREGRYETVESEYLVTDGEHYASAIDVVWSQDGETVVLVDKKTTSKYYGESVEWQLSIYAYMFEQMNPDVKVSGLLGCWLPAERYGKARLVACKRHSVEEVRRLLQSGVDGTSFVPDDPLESRQDEPDSETQMLLFTLNGVDRQMKELKEQRDELVSQLMAIMTRTDVKKYETDTLMVIRKEETESKKFDSKGFKADHADLYEAYMKTSKVAGSLTVKLK